MEPGPPSEGLSPKPGEDHTKDKAQRRMWVSLLILLGVVVGLAGSLVGRKVMSAGQVFIAQRLAAQVRYAQAMPVLHSAIRNNPKNAEAYLQRATCYGSTPTNVFDECYRNLVYSIYDLDSVIAPRPGVGDYYVDKELIFRELANIMNDSASEFMYYQLATQSAAYIFLSLIVAIYRCFDFSRFTYIT